VKLGTQPYYNPACTFVQTLAETIEQAE
jgi:hypothetical protein